MIWSERPGAASELAEVDPPMPALRHRLAQRQSEGPCRSVAAAGVGGLGEEAAVIEGQKGGLAGRRDSRRGPADPPEAPQVVSLSDEELASGGASGAPAGFRAGRRGSNELSAGFSSSVGGSSHLELHEQVAYHR